MPVKCSFCRKRYARAGAYEKHLRTTHSNLDIILASTILNPPANSTEHHETGIFADNAASKGSDSDYESDAASDPAGYERNAMNDEPMHEYDTQVLGDNTSSVPATSSHYPGAGEPIGDVEGYEEELRNLCENAWAPFTNAQGFKLASWFIESKVPKSRINNYFSSGLGNPASVGYSSMYTLENHLQSLDPFGLYLQWLEGQVEDGMRTLPFFYRNILDCVRYLLRQITYRDDLVYAPRREYDQAGQRIYAEMHTADWWWDVQVWFPAFFHQMLLTFHRIHCLMGRRLFQSSGCLIRHTSPTSQETRKHGQFTLRSEI